jgi:MerR family transcriptional regulator, light-induced transcriptional regulator
MSRPARYTIRAACALTGLNPNTLRAWERRYGLVRPERTASGYRLYTNDDLELLKQIQGLLESGMPVGRILDHVRPAGARPRRRPARVTIADPAPRRDLESVSWGGAVLEHDAHAASGLAPDEAGAHRARMRRAALAGDCNALLKHFNRAVGLYSVAEAFDQVLLSAARELADDRTAESRAAAGLITAFARARLVTVLSGMRHLHQHPQVLTVALGAGPHEHALMRLTLTLGLERVSARFVGADVPLDETLGTTDLRSLRAAVVACGQAEDGPALETLARRLRGHPRRPALMVLAPAELLDAPWIARSGASHRSSDAIGAANTLLQLLRKG